MIETFNGLHGLRGWQWMYLLQGLPAIPVAVWVWRALPNGPASASWLTPEQRAVLAADASSAGAMPWTGALWAALKDRRVQLISLAAFLVKSGSFALVFWVPPLIRESGVSDARTVGLLSTIPNLLVLPAMAYLGLSSDRRTERRWHFAGAALVGATSLLWLGVMPRSTETLILILCMAAAGLASAVPILWATLSAAVSPRKAAISIAFAGSLSNLSGFAGPVVLGMSKQFHNEASGFGLLALLVGAGALLIPACLKEPAYWSAPDDVAPGASALGQRT